MSRNARALSTSGVYHVMFRGLNRQKIFLESKDYEKLIEILTELKEKFSFEIYAYCIMSNHAHFIIKENNTREVSDIMHNLLTKYARWFNIKYERTGTLMESRYKSRAVELDEYFVHVVRYVHQNPVRAGIVENIADYPWSSYGDYLSKKAHLTDTEFLWEIMPKDEYIDFHAVEETDDFELTDSVRPTDDELVNDLKKLGISDPKSLDYLPPAQFEEVVLKLRKRFSDRHIARVTEASRYRINHVSRGQ